LVTRSQTMSAATNIHAAAKESVCPRKGPDIECEAGPDEHTSADIASPASHLLHFAARTQKQGMAGCILYGVVCPVLCDLGRANEAK